MADVDIPIRMYKKNLEQSSDFIELLRVDFIQSADYLNVIGENGWDYK